MTGILEAVNWKMAHRRFLVFLLCVRAAASGVFAISTWEAGREPGNMVASNPDFLYPRPSDYPQTLHHSCLEYPERGISGLVEHECPEYTGFQGGRMASGPACCRTGTTSSRI